VKFSIVSSQAGSSFDCVFFVIYIPHSVTSAKEPFPDLEKTVLWFLNYALQLRIFVQTGAGVLVALSQVTQTAS